MLMTMDMTDVVVMRRLRSRSDVDDDGYDGCGGNEKVEESQ